MRFYCRVRDDARFASAASGDRGELRISQHAWNGSRGVYLANKVATLAKGGCKVSVIYGVGMGSTVRNILVRAKVAMSAGTHKGIRTHEKYLLLKGGYGDNPAAQIVWTGSHNWTPAQALSI